MFVLFCHHCLPSRVIGKRKMKLIAVLMLSQQVIDISRKVACHSVKHSILGEVSVGTVRTVLFELLIVLACFLWLEGGGYLHFWLDLYSIVWSRFIIRPCFLNITGLGQ